MGFGDIADTINDAMLDAFGEESTFNLTRIQSGEGTLVFRGVLGPGPELEPNAPGDGSVLARVFAKASVFDPPPEEGDEVSTPTTIYKVVHIDKDAGGWMALTLRQDRQAS